MDKRHRSNQKRFRIVRDDGKRVKLPKNQPPKGKIEKFSIPKKIQKRRKRGY